MHRRLLLGLLLLVNAALGAAPAMAGAGSGETLDGGDPIVIGHRGASGERPEHTLASYKLAIEQCADFIEPDLVSTKDHQLVARHENSINDTTDVAEHPEFADRQTTKTVDGIPSTGWFTEDFTLAELKTLRATERLPDVRPDNATYDGKFGVPTFKEVLALARRSRTCDGRPVGVYPETKHPSYFDSLDLSLEEPLVRALRHRGPRGRRVPVYIQSFEVAGLQQLADLIKLPLVQLINCFGQPADFVAAGDPRTYADLVTPTGLEFVATYADGIGPCTNLVIPNDGAGNLGTPTTLVADAHANDLVVHPFTFRRENQFLRPAFRRGTDPNAPGDLAAEIRAYLATGIDGFFTDNPAIGREAVES
jgi:glycerophosphoryl diester phosphodiesterase